MRISRKLARQYREGIKCGQAIVTKNRAGLPVYAAMFPEHGTPQHRAALHVVMAELDLIARRAARILADMKQDRQALANVRTEPDHD